MASLIPGRLGRVAPGATASQSVLGDLRLQRTLRAHLRKADRGPVAMAGALVREERLKNGMRVLIAERHADPVVSVLLLYRVGARNESEREAGVSHFLEHMMFKGTPRFGKGEVDRITTELGGQNNAFTGYDHTAYWFELASDRWETALDLEADRMHGLLLDPREFDSERAVVLEELSMGEDDPWRVLARRVEQALFPRHPYGRPIIGFEDTLNAMTPQDMRDYYRRFYHPANATLVLCGDVRPRRALAAVRERFGSLDAGPGYEEADGFRPPLAAPEGPARIEARWADPGRRLCMAWSTAPVGSDDDYALDLVAAILSSGRLSRLQRRLVLREGLATSLSTSNDTRVEGGVFWLMAECAQGVEPAALERAIDEELARLANEPVTADERKRALGLLDASEAFDAETVTDVAEEIGAFAVDFEWRAAYDGGVRHREVRAKHIQDAVRRLLSPERRVVGWSLPIEEPAATTKASKRKKAKKAKATAKPAARKKAAKAARKATGQRTRASAKTTKPKRKAKAKAKAKRAAAATKRRRT